MSKEKVNPTKDEFYTAFEPKAKNRFIVYVKDPRTTDPKATLIPAYLIKCVTRPSLRLDQINGENKWKWLPIYMELYDPITPSGAKIMQEYVKTSVSFDVVIKVLCSVGDVVEEWKITNARVVEIDNGTLDWGSKGDPVDIKLTIEFEHAELLQ